MFYKFSSFLPHTRFTNTYTYLICFRFYPYIMLTSCIFLVVTVIVYSVVPKLLNSYSKLMLHYSTSLMLGLLCMAIIQLGNNWHEKPKSCSFLGKCVYICDSELERFDAYKSFYFRFYHSIFLYKFVYLHECNGC